jgi:hypothetical protein
MSAHVHHWLIQPANGPTSKGKCQGCGETREFQNTIEWDAFASTRPGPKKRGADPVVRPREHIPYWYGNGR